MDEDSEDFEIGFGDEGDDDDDDDEKGCISSKDDPMTPTTHSERLMEEIEAMSSPPPNAPLPTPSPVHTEHSDTRREELALEQKHESAEHDERNKEETGKEGREKEMEMQGRDKKNEPEKEMETEVEIAKEKIDDGKKEMETKQSEQCPTGGKKQVGKAEVGGEELVKIREIPKEEKVAEETVEEAKKVNSGEKVKKETKKKEKKEKKAKEEKCRSPVTEPPSPPPAPPSPPPLPCELKLDRNLHLQEEMASGKAKGEGSDDANKSEAKEAPVGPKEEQSQQTPIEPQQVDTSKGKAGTPNKTETARDTADAAKGTADSVSETDTAKEKTDTTKGKTDIARGKADAVKVTDTAKEKTDIAKGKADSIDTGKEKTDTTKGKTDSAKGEADTTMEKTDSVKGDVDTGKEKTDIAKGKTDSAKGEADTTMEKTDSAKGKADSAKETDTAKSKADSAKGEAGKAKEKTDTSKGKTDSAKGEADTTKEKTDTSKGNVDTSKDKADSTKEAGPAKEKTSTADTANNRSHTAKEVTDAGKDTPGTAKDKTDTGEDPTVAAKDEAGTVLEDRTHTAKEETSEQVQADTTREVTDKAKKEKKEKKAKKEKKEKKRVAEDKNEEAAADAEVPLTAEADKELNETTGKKKKKAAKTVVTVKQATIDKEEIQGKEEQPSTQLESEQQLSPKAPAERSESLVLSPSADESLLSPESSAMIEQAHAVSREAMEKQETVQDQEPRRTTSDEAQKAREEKERQIEALEAEANEQAAPVSEEEMLYSDSQGPSPRSTLHEEPSESATVDVSIASEKASPLGREVDSVTQPPTSEEEGEEGEGMNISLKTADLEPVMQVHTDALRESQRSMKEMVRRGSSAKSLELRKKEAAVENFIRCGAVAIERGLAKLDSSIAEHGVKQALILMEVGTMRIMKSSRPALDNAMNMFTKTISAENGMLKGPEASEFFKTLVRASIDVLLPAAEKWIQKLHEIYGSEPERLKDLLGTGSINEMRATLSARWEDCEREIAQLWHAFCTTSKDGISFQKVEDAFVGDQSVNLAAITQVVLCRPRLSNPKDCFAPVASCSPLFAAVPQKWVISASSQPSHDTYRFVFTKARNGGSFYELSSIRLIRVGGDVVEPALVKSVVMVTSAEDDEAGVEDEEHPAQNLMVSGSHWAGGDADVPCLVEIQIRLTAPEKIAGYIFQTAPEDSPPDTDPIEWVFQAEANDDWTTLHNNNSLKVPKTRSTWCRPYIYSDSSALIDWFGDHLLVKDGLGCRLIPTEKALSGKNYIIVVLLSNWMLEQNYLYTEAMVHFYKRNSKKKKIEIVLVSGDPMLEDFQRMYKNLPWAAVVHSETARRKELETLCNFDGTPKAVVFHAIERSMEDLTPVLLTEDGFSWARRDREAKKFPWVTEQEDVTVQDVEKSAEPAARESKKAKYIPLIVVAYSVALGILGLWPLVLGATSYGKGTCTKRADTPQAECVEASSASGATCNSSLLDKWFIINGVITSVFILIAVYIFRDVWKSGLSRWDITLAQNWVTGCLWIIILIFLSIWYVIGNMLIWRADDDLCGALSIQGRYFFCTTYGLYCIALCYIFKKIFCEPRKKPVRNLAHDIEMGTRTGPPIRQAKPKRVKKKLHLNPSVLPHTRRK